MSDLARRRFRNALCILRSIDLHELEAAGVVCDRAEWNAFQDDEARFFLKLDDARQEGLWALIEARMPERFRERTTA